MTKQKKAVSACSPGTSSGHEEKPPEAPAEPESPDPGVKDPEPPQAPLFEFFNMGESQYSDDQIKDIVNRQVIFDLSKSDVADRYNVLFLFETQSIIRADADKIYNAVTKADPNKSTLLVLSSHGGDIAAAYFIAKLCREYTTKNFETVVPRQAKSAATLICCGADRIHMGSLSELGPIDPQFGGVPALALKHSVEHLAQLTKDYPDAAEMFSSYLAKSLRVEALGYYERMAESAAEYAIRLLNSRRVSKTGGMSSEQIADQLVYKYKDHGFVIDSREALDIFGDSVVVCNTPEYKAANLLYQNLDFMAWICNSTYKKNLSYIGSTETGCWLFPKTN